VDSRSDQASPSTPPDVEALDAVVAAIEDEAAAFLSDRPDSTVTIGFSLGGRRIVRYLRAAGAEHAPEPDAGSIYEIGSVSKVVTTTLLAVLEQRGVLSLDDTIADHLPALSLAPDIAAITIRDLATHSAGFANLGTVHQAIIATEQRGTEPPWGCYTHYLRYRKEHLYADLESAELVHATGTGYLYSVLGMGTLGHIIELATGRQYEPLLRELVCEPLGLTDVAYTLSPEQLERLVVAYDIAGQPCPSWYHDVMLPQGGLRGTVADLLTFTEAHLAASRGDDDSELARAMRRTREVHWTAPDDFRMEGVDGPVPFVLGLAWMGLTTPEPGRHLWWHPGTTLFYKAGCGVDPVTGICFATLYSSRTGVIDPFDAMEVGWYRKAVAAVEGGARDE
jgi:CubicO group peptidase (beta-lactamase class C family)